MTDCLKREGVKSVSDKEHRLPDARCLDCNQHLDAATGVNGDDAPGDGDVTICIECGHIMVFAADLSLRNPTDAELVQIAGDPLIVSARRLLQLAKDAE